MLPMLRDIKNDNSPFFVPLSWALNTKRRGQEISRALVCDGNSVRSDIDETFVSQARQSRFHISRTPTLPASPEERQHIRCHRRDGNNAGELNSREDGPAHLAVSQFS